MKEKLVKTWFEYDDITFDRYAGKDENYIGARKCPVCIHPVSVMQLDSKFWICPDCKSEFIKGVTGMFLMNPKEETK